MKKFMVSAERSGNWWALSTSGSNVNVWTQCRRLEEAEQTAREAIALASGLCEQEFAIDLEVNLPKRLQSVAASARSASDLAAVAQDAANALLAQAADELSSYGLSVRDTGTLLGISGQRVSQIIGKGPIASKEVHAAVTALATSIDVMHAKMPNTARPRQSSL